MFGGELAFAAWWSMIITSHYGLDGTATRTMREVHHDLGLPRTELREALAGGLAKLRISLAG